MLASMAKILNAFRGRYDEVRATYSIPNHAIPRCSCWIEKTPKFKHMERNVPSCVGMYLYVQMVRNKLIHDLCCFDSSPLSSYRVLREKFHSKVRGLWWHGYSNPAVDLLIDEAQATVDMLSRQRIYRQAFRTIRDDAPWLFLYSLNLNFGVGRNAKHWRPGINGLVKLGHMY
jgi:hypothetical protein